jgi:glycosyltransferase involved in cell wall biosynthesis
LGTHAPRALSLAPVPPGQHEPDRVYPRITIVVPSFNQGRFIGATLESVTSQQYPNLELIVVDGGSRDETVSVIRQYEPHLAWWVSEPDAGQTAAINKGFARSTGEIMGWLNSDDLLAPGALRRIADHFSTRQGAHAVYGNRILIDEEGLEISSWILPGHSSRVLQWADFVPQETLYWTRSAWNRVGARLDEKFRFAMDWDFLLRLSGQGIPIHHMAVFLGMFRIHQSQKTSAQISSVGLQEMQLLRKRELGYVPTRLQMILNTLPYLLRARLLELRFRAGAGRGA